MTSNTAKKIALLPEQHLAKSAESYLVHAPNKKKKRFNPAQKEERIIALITIVTPAIGTLIALVSLWLYGISWVEVGLCLGMYILTTLGITAGYHHLFTHRSFQTGKTIQVLLVIFGSMAVQGPILFWVATHRRHHLSSDRPEEPHSPYYANKKIGNKWQGFWYAHVGWMLNHNPEDWSKYVPDLLRDSWIFKLHQWYFYWVFLGLFAPAVLGGLLTNSWTGIISGLLWGGLVRIFLVHHSTWSINSLCHLFGSRPDQTEDFSTNNVICALLAFGEGWHNNHHAFPNSARHGLQWWQIDLTYIWQLHSSGKISILLTEKIPTIRDLEEYQKTCPQSIDVQEYYQQCQQRGINY